MQKLTIYGKTTDFICLPHTQEIITNFTFLDGLNSGQYSDIEFVYDCEIKEFNFKDHILEKALKEYEEEFNDIISEESKSELKEFLDNWVSENCTTKVVPTDKKLKFTFEK